LFDQHVAKGQLPDVKHYLPSHHIAHIANANKSLQAPPPFRLPASNAAQNLAEMRVIRPTVINPRPMASLFGVSEPLGHSLGYPTFTS